MHFQCTYYQFAKVIFASYWWWTMWMMIMILTMMKIVAKWVMRREGACTIGANDANNKYAKSWWRWWWWWWYRWWYWRWWRLWQSEWWGGRGARTILRDIAKWLSIMLCNTNVCQCVHQCIPMYTNVRTPMYAKWLSINIISIILCNTNVPIYVRSCVSNVCHALAPTGTLYVIMIQAAVHLKFNEMFQPTALYSQCNLFMIYCNHWLEAAVQRILWLSNF